MMLRIEDRNETAIPFERSSCKSNRVSVIYYIIHNGLQIDVDLQNYDVLEAHCIGDANALSSRYDSIREGSPVASFRIFRS